MSWLEALILGIVQGLTEFLPVSSSGHLEIGQALLGTSGEDNLTFAVIVHAATVLSTLVVLWREVAQLFTGTFTTPKWNEEKNKQIEELKQENTRLLDEIHFIKSRGLWERIVNRF